MDKWKTDEVIDWYLGRIRPTIPYYEEQLSLIVEIMSWNSREIESFLDIGAGDGFLAQTLLSKFPSATAVLVDFSDRMRTEAEKRLQPFASRWEYVVADLSQPDWATSLPFFEFDAVVSSFCIHHLEHPVKRDVYEAVFKLLGAGGCFLNLEHVAAESEWGEELHEHLVESALIAQENQKPSPRSPDLVATEYRERPDKAANILLDLDNQIRSLREIGFEDVDAFFRWMKYVLFGGRKPGVPDER